MSRQLHELSARLSMLTDQLNESLLNLERALTEARLGVSAEIVIVSPDEAFPRPALRIPPANLRFGKEDGAWRLTIVHPDGRHEPITKGSKMHRIRAAQRVPELLEAIIDSAERQVTEFTEASKLIQSLTAEVTKAIEKKP